MIKCIILNWKSQFIEILHHLLITLFNHYIIKNVSITNKKHIFWEIWSLDPEFFICCLKSTRTSLSGANQGKSLQGARPIVSDCSSETYYTAEFIDFHLNPLSTKHASYIKDTYDFVEKVKQIHIPLSSFLFTMDIDSLYTNIDIKEGLQATKNIFQYQSIQTARRLIRNFYNY